MSEYVKNRLKRFIQFHVISSPLSTCASRLLYLVTEDLNLSIGSVDWPAATAVVVAVRVDLNNHRHPLHTLLRGEVCAQTVDGDEDL